MNKSLYFLLFLSFYHVQLLAFSYYQAVSLEEMLEKGHIVLVKTKNFIQDEKQEGGHSIDQVFIYEVDVISCYGLDYLCEEIKDKRYVHARFSYIDIQEEHYLKLMNYNGHYWVSGHLSAFFQLIDGKLVGRGFNSKETIIKDIDQWKVF